MAVLTLGCFKRFYLEVTLHQEDALLYIDAMLFTARTVHCATASVV
jgi:hypothetical protein